MWLKGWATPIKWAPWPVPSKRSPPPSHLLLRTVPCARTRAGMPCSLAFPRDGGRPCFINSGKLLRTVRRVGTQPFSHTQDPKLSSVQCPGKASKVAVAPPLALLYLLPLSLKKQSLPLEQGLADSALSSRPFGEDS